MKVIIQAHAGDFIEAMGRAKKAIDLFFYRDYWIRMRTEKLIKSL